LFPELSLGEVGAWSYVRSAAGVAAGTAFAIWIAMAPGMTYSHERPAPSARRQASASIHSLKSLPTAGLGAAGFVGLALGSVVSFGRRRRVDAKHPRD
ncbi:MAG TPA: hypothetical protein VGC79_19650, partial [Polyangiaceae bacterium]